MRPTTIRHALIQAVEKYADPHIGDRDLLGKLEADCPSASRVEVSRAALYASTDCTRQNIRVTKRLFDFAMTVRAYRDT
jgi:hypothetical protein